MSSRITSGSVAAEDLERDTAVLGHRHGVTVRLEAPFQQQSVHAVVLDDEHRADEALPDVLTLERFDRRSCLSPCPLDSPASPVAASSSPSLDTLLELRTGGRERLRSRT